MKGMASYSGCDDDIGTFGVVMAHQTGRWDSPTTTNMVAHLVSIQSLESKPAVPNSTKIKFPVSQPREALCPLFPWTYTVYPHIR